jgi:predicted PurR-regulated permease PerM
LFTFGLVGIFLAPVVLVVGGIAVRVYCELLILMFRIHDTLQEIKEQRK